MNLRQLECFCLISESLNFSRAAEQLYMTQSAVTQQISALERELGCRLFDRNTKKVSLTQTGRAFYTRVVNSVYEIKNAVQLAQEEHRQAETSFVVGYYDMSVERFAPRLIEAFLRRYPQTEPSFIPIKPPRMLASLRKRQIDCALMVPEDVEFDSAQFRFTPLCTIGLYAVMSKNHPLAGKTSVSIEQLRGYTAREITPAAGQLAQPDPYYKTLRVMEKIHTMLEADALPIELNDGRVELLRVKSSELVILRAGYGIPKDDELVAIPLEYDFHPQYGIVTLPKYRRIVASFVELAREDAQKQIFKI